MHEQFLLAALEQARLGRGFCAPNPCVGAVAVKNNTIIAQAWHQGAGTSHAEQLLIAQLPPKTPGVSLYCTLEPCNHWGKTPPCTDAIIEYGFEEVYYAFNDPNPLVANNDSSAQLRANDIKVTHIPVAAIDEFYKSYAHWIKTGHPRVTVKIAQSLDGKIGRVGSERVILSNALCAHFTHTMRAETDIILTTARTIHLDDPQMNVRLPDREQRKPVAIIDKNLALPADAQIFSTASHCHVYHHEVKENPYTNSSLHSMPLLHGQIDLSAVMRHIGSLGYHDVWVEAGAGLFNALHQQKLVNKTYIYIVPVSLGRDSVTLYNDQSLFERAETISWQAMGDNMMACIEWQEAINYEVQP